MEAVTHMAAQGSQSSMRLTWLATLLVYGIVVAAAELAGDTALARQGALGS